MQTMTGRVGEDQEGGRCCKAPKLWVVIQPSYYAEEIPTRLQHEVVEYWH